MKFFAPLLTAALLAGQAVFAAELVSAPAVITGSNGVATIAWATDVPTGGRVQLGVSLVRLDRRESDDVGKSHQVRFDRLLPGTQYFYTVGTARVTLATNSFVTPGNGAVAKVEPKSVEKSFVKPATKVASTAPSARETWGNLASLADHFERHGADFKAKNAEDYARLAWEFLQRARSEGLAAKLDDDGVLRVFDRKSGTFASYNRDGTTKTFFKPGSADYFERQPGEPVKLKTLKLN